MDYDDVKATLSYAVADHADFATRRAADPRGVMVGNGKLCAFPSYDGVDTHQAFLTTGARPTPLNAAQPNVVPAFRCNRVRFFRAATNLNDALPLALLGQSLDMNTGVVTSRFRCTHPTTNAALFDVESDLFAARQFPHVIVQTVRLYPATQLPELFVKHEIYIDDDRATQVSFSSTQIYNPRETGPAPPPTSGTYITEARCTLAQRGLTMAAGSAYAFDTSAVSAGTSPALTAFLQAPHAVAFIMAPPALAEFHVSSAGLSSGALAALAGINALRAASPSTAPVASVRAVTAPADVLSFAAPSAPADAGMVKVRLAAGAPFTVVDGTAFALPSLDAGLPDAWNVQGATYTARVLSGYVYDTSGGAQEFHFQPPLTADMTPFYAYLSSPPLPVPAGQMVAVETVDVTRIEEETGGPAGYLRVTLAAAPAHVPISPAWASVTFSDLALSASAPWALEVMGFNVYRSDPSRCYSLLRAADLAPVADPADPARPVPVTFTVVSVALHSDDFPDPASEVRRLLLSLQFSQATPWESAARVRRDHVSEWARLWRMGITVQPKDGVTTAEAAEVRLVRRHLKYAMYNLLSSTREGMQMTWSRDSFQMGAIDLTGGVAVDGDLWLLPVLTAFLPEVARAVLEYRYNSLGTATQLASVYGLRGAKYPYAGDAAYSDSLYDTVGPFHVFNNALVAICAWNYYRVSRDRDWLQTRGYPMIKGVADMFASRMTAASPPDGRPHLYSVTSINQARSSDDNTLTNYLVRLAIKFAVEASYELTMPVKDAWLSLFYGLPVTRGPQDVLLFDPAAAALPSETYQVLETLIPLVRVYSAVLHRVDGVLPQAALANVQDQVARTADGYELTPVNIMLRAMMYGQYAQANPAAFTASIEQFRHELVDNLFAGATPVWGSLTRASSAGYNDVSLSGMLLLTVLCAMCGMEVRGAVAETRFYTDEMKVTMSATGAMPRYWRGVKVTGYGPDSDQTTNVINSVYY
jgi:hypothetical protein